ncbi:hypothetical protein LTR62_005680 [Meristemomyces frigidus]|uniref:EKC/KEOPS complex subunit CGI121 n=1 Tax=Meristemomyces frigidus TaxID=1508187 RepID=A0AAN7TPA6_9PEZI|nr:hypothetical protein LTR62_005680 [Meristemomyces frigidus]
METITLPHLPNHPLQLLLFRNVKNAAFLRQQLLDGNTDFEYAFLDAAVILSRQHVLAACFKAINGISQGRLKSKNVHSEIVFDMSPNSNISESFRRFGVSDTTKDILAIKVAPKDPAQVEQHLRDSVRGTTIFITDENLASMTDQARIRKAYKVDVVSQEAEAYIIGCIAIKGS